MPNLMYTVTFALTEVLLLILIVKFRSKVAPSYFLLFVSVLIVNFGYMQLTAAEDLSTAVYANQTAYLGTCFSPFFLLLCMANLCKTKIPKAVLITLGVWAEVIFILVSTLGLTDLYYKEMWLEQVNGVGKLVKVYGPLHFLYPTYILVSCGICLFVILRCIRRKRMVSYHTSLLLLACMTVIIVVYFAERWLKTDMEWIPVAYAFSLAIVMYLIRRISLYDVATISALSMVDSFSYGFVIMDSKACYLGCDVAAIRWFPELGNLRIDQKISEEDSEFLKLLGAWSRGEDERESVYLNQNGNIIEAKPSVLKEGRHKKLFCVYLRDDTKQYQYTKLVESYKENLERDVEIKTEKINRIQDDIIISMASIVENRDNNTGGHIKRTSDIMEIFVKHLQQEEGFSHMDKHTAKRIIKAAPLHDFGKIAIPDVVLNKPGKFTDEEYAIMKQHSAKGAVIVERILQNSEDELFRKIAVNVAHYHHEKWDGKGYPEGIKGEEIPFEARVMALADVFDALVSKRVYKESFGYDKAFSIIEESCGTHFDPTLCKEFLKCRPELEKLYNSYED